jgi:hypothetical protein
MLASRRATLTDLAVVGAVMAFAAAQSWRRWLDPIVDTGRDLYIAEQLGRGLRLYRDIRYEYPPLAPYLLAGITRFTGHSLAAYAAIGFAQSIAIAALLWFIARRVGGRWAALTTTLLFAAVNFTGATLYNFIFPYSYAATLGVLFVLAFVACVIAERIPFALLFGIAASWCKFEYAIVVLVAMFVFEMRWRDRMLLALASIPTVAFLPKFNAPIARHFYAVLSGIADWRSRLAEALIGAAVLVAIELMIRRGWRKPAMFAAIAAGTFAPWTTIFRGCGILQWIALVRPRDRLMFALSAVSIASTLRVVLNVAPVWYGFVLILPLYLLIANATRGDFVWVALIVALCAHSLHDQREDYAKKQFPIVTPRGTFFDSNPDRAAILNAAIPRLRGRTLAVFPEGISLNYFADAPTTLTFQTFTPIETGDPKVEAQIVAEMSGGVMPSEVEASPSSRGIPRLAALARDDTRGPDRVVFVKRDLREYQAKEFGVDYDRTLRAFIESRYVMEKTWVRPQFSLAMWRRPRTVGP